eukprot:TRINITY_DN22772_c0_g1_i1.p1 TRINITY_DN22772_c0_g1~~TRINITY_DN22772_c0_g1_i1.p1  ORF type:complete len:169 (+),score=37.32 TRINITY_DN22772_c0_g1_i1:50-508(+)
MFNSQPACAMTDPGSNKPSRPDRPGKGRAEPGADRGHVQQPAQQAVQYQPPAQHVYERPTQQVQRQVQRRPASPPAPAVEQRQIQPQYLGMSHHNTSKPNPPQPPSATGTRPKNAFTSAPSSALAQPSRQAAPTRPSRLPPALMHNQVHASY